MSPKSKCMLLNYWQNFVAYSRIRRKAVGIFAYWCLKSGHNESGTEAAAAQTQDSATDLLLHPGRFPGFPVPILHSYPQTRYTNILATNPSLLSFLTQITFSRVSVGTFNLTVSLHAVLSVADSRYLPQGLAPSSMTSPYTYTFLLCSYKFQSQYNYNPEFLHIPRHPHLVPLPSHLLRFFFSYLKLWKWRLIIPGTFFINSWEKSMFENVSNIQ